jgi:nucleotide-binding universal stress UspA family protein
MTENTHPEKHGPRPVVVGVDGSENSGHAAVWAAEEAERRGTTLTVVHALHLPDPAAAPIEPTGYAQRRHAEGTTLLDKAATALRARFPELTLDLELSGLDPAHALAELSHTAALLVTGTRGHGGFTGMLLGSVSRKLAAHGHCPLVVVHGEPMPDAAGDIVLGIGSDPGEATTRYAFEAARRRGACLIVLSAWRPNAMDTGMAGVGTVYADSPSAERRDAITSAETATKPLRDEYPDVTVRIDAVEGNAVTVLLDAARGAQLLVVGEHRRRGPLWVGPGYVVDGVLAHSTAPVAVVPEH